MWWPNGILNPISPPDIRRVLKGQQNSVIEMLEYYVVCYQSFSHLCDHNLNLGLMDVVGLDENFG